MGTPLPRPERTQNSETASEAKNSGLRRDFCNPEAGETSVDETKVVIRSYVAETDRNFILSTWLKGQYWGNAHFKQIEQDAYFEHHGALVRAIVDSPNTLISIACSESAPTWIAGFSIARVPELYWVHVRDGFRNRGIAKLLVPDGITIIKALTKIGSAIARRKKLIFDPY